MPGRHLRFPASVAIGAVVLAAAGGWFAAQRIQSPAEIAARAEPPEPSLITVPVELAELTSAVVLRGDVEYDEPIPVAIVGSLGPGIEAPIVTAVPAVGDVVADGDVLLEVAGRPVLVIEGAIPMYRALRPGAVGTDVAQLERALARLGHLSTAPDDRWDEATSAAVAAWYDAAGFLPNEAPAEEAAALDAAEDRVAAATAALGEAEAALTEAGEGPGEPERLSAQFAVTAARDELETAEEAAAAAASANAAAVAAAEGALADATALHEMATQRLAQAESGIHPDTGEPPTADELVAFRAAAADGATRQSDARAELERVRHEAAASADEHELTVRRRGEAVALAEAQLRETIAPPDTKAARRAVDAATSELAAARAELEELEAQSGPWIPAGQLVVAPALPARVDAVAVAVGDTLAGDAVTLSAGTLTIRTAVPVRSAELVTVGTPVVVDHPSLTLPVDGTVAMVAERPGTEGVAADAYQATVVAPGLPPETEGLNVRIVASVGGTGGKVLAVPAAALSVSTGGETTVEVVEGDGTRLVAVEPGLAAEGLVQITPLEEGAVVAGALVVVGRDLSI